MYGEDCAHIVDEHSSVRDLPSFAHGANLVCPGICNGGLTIRAFDNSANQNGPYTAKISQHITRLSQMKAEVLEESRKRPAPPTETEVIKRMKLENQVVQQAQVTPTPTPPPPAPLPTQQVITGPMSYAQLYTLSTDVAMTSFDGQQLPIDLVLQIIIGSICSMSQYNLDAAIAVYAQISAPRIAVMV